MSLATATQALGVAVAARVPVLLWGAPGTGKTATIKAVAQAMGWPCETVIASIREPSDFAGLPVVIDGGWEAQQRVTLALTGAFLRVRPALVSAPPADAAAAGKGWPSPRTWEMAARLWAAGTAAAASEEAKALLVAGSVGDGAAAEFLAWVTEMDLPDPEAVLADPASFTLPRRSDRAYAAVSAVAAVVAADPTPQRWAAGWQVLGIAAKSAPDVAAVAARILARCQPAGAPTPAEVRQFAPVLREAGLLG